MLRREQALGLFLLIVALSSGAAAFAFVQARWQPPVVLDADRCPSLPAAAWFAVLDHTDIHPPQEQERIAAGVIAIAERMRRHDRLALFVITGRAEDSAAPWPLSGFPNGFRLCKSTDPKAVDRLVANERLARTTYEREFLNPLRSVLPEFVKGGVAQRSPILQAVETMMWSPLFRGDIPERTLVIFSDFLNRTAPLSHLSGPTANACQVLASDIGVRLKARNWRGVRVVMEYVRNPRDTLRQTPEHLQFWAQLFYLVGAAQVFNSSALVPNDGGTCPAATRSFSRR